jgi:hypothetical protein
LASVPIDNLVPGMVLSRDVCDRSGRLLLPAGAELTEKHFSIFRMWGVFEAEIVGEEAAHDAELPLHVDLDPVLLAVAQNHVQLLFVHNDQDHPAIKELIRFCIERRASRAP